MTDQRSDDLNKAYNEGLRSRRAGTVCRNPYFWTDADLWNAFQQGWCDGTSESVGRLQASFKAVT